MLISTILFPIILFITFNLFYYSTVKFTLDEGLRVKICFALFSVEMYHFKESRKKRRTKRSFYYLLVRRISTLLKHGTMRIEQLRIPRSEGEICARSFTTPYGYHTLISTLVAYLNHKTKKLIIDNDAITLDPDPKAEFSFVFSIRLDTLRIIIALVKIWRDHKKEKINKYYVGN